MQKACDKGNILIVEYLLNNFNELELSIECINIIINNKYYKLIIKLIEMKMITPEIIQNYGLEMFTHINKN